MIYIATVHWKSSKWIKIQDNFLKKNMGFAFRKFGVLNGISADFSTLFYRSYSNKVIASHAKNLNFLADEICKESQDDNDYIFFLDGDAFPISKIDNTFLEKITKRKLVAVQRIENYGDIQPHPSFCATTVGFWKEIEGDWSAGYCWKDKQGELVTDVGGNLLKILEQNKIEWLPILRSNKENIAPLAFGIYGDIVYHHAFGFRSGYGGRIVLAQNDLKFNNIPIHLKALKKIGIPWFFRSYFDKRGHISRKFMRSNKKIYCKIKNDNINFDEL